MPNTNAGSASRPNAVDDDTLSISPPGRLADAIASGTAIPIAINSASTINSSVFGSDSRIRSQLLKPFVTIESPKSSRTASPTQLR